MLISIYLFLFLIMTKSNKILIKPFYVSSFKHLLPLLLLDPTALESLQNQAKNHSTKLADDLSDVPAWELFIYFFIIPFSFIF